MLSRIVAGVWKWGEWGWNLNTQDIHKLIVQSIEVGVTTFDHADIYGHYTDEANFGRALQLEPSLRAKMQIITKCGIKLTSTRRPEHKIKSYDTSREHIIKSVENSLKSLKTDYLDVLLIHRPDILFNPHEVAETIDFLKNQGKILHFGVSNFTPSQVDMLYAYMPVLINQVEISVLKYNAFEDGTLDNCLKNRIIPMAWSPLGSGKIFSDMPDEATIRIKKAALALSEKYNNASLDQILLAWLMRHPTKIAPVLGTARIERIKDAVGALQIKLTAEEWYEIWQAARGREIA